MSISPKATFFVIFLLFVSLSNAYGSSTQGSLHVFAHNNRTLDPISGATVTIIDGPNCQNSGTAVTDSSGVAMFPNLIQGTYQVKVDAINYTTQVASGAISASESDTDVYLDPDFSTQKLTVSVNTGGSVIFVSGFAQTFSISNGATQTFSVPSDTRIVLQTSPFIPHSSCGSISENHFTGWTGTIASQDSQLSFSMASDMSETASFAQGYGLPSATKPSTAPLQTDNQIPAVPNVISVSTDKLSYTYGDHITISGQVSKIISSYPVIIRIQAPNGNLISAQQLTVLPDNTFSGTIIAGGSSWAEDGTYTVLAQYAPKFDSSQSSFEFTKPSPVILQPQTTPETVQQPTTQSSQPQAEPIKQQSWLAMPSLPVDIQSLAAILAIIVGICGAIAYLVRKSKEITARTAQA